MVEEATIELEKDTKEVKPAKLKKRKKKIFTIFDIPILLFLV